jgi:hypothetical protein
MILKNRQILKGDQMSTQINPTLIQLLLKQKTKVTDPLHKMTLPGKYVKMIRKNIKSIEPLIAVNHDMLKCKDCGRKGKYDVGQMAVNIDKKKTSESMMDRIQLTGYFRSIVIALEIGSCLIHFS